MSNSAFGYQIERLVHEGARSRIYFAHRATDGVPVVIKTARSHPPTPERLRALSREYELLHSLEGVAGIPEAYALKRDGSRWGLVMSRLRGRSLAERQLAGVPEFSRFVELALAISAMLAELHRRHIVHKDFTPANLLLEDDRAASLHVIDFGSATLFGHEPRPCVGPGGIEGSLAYVSPEQTGRTSRAVDYRSDYYSLGVSLFELLTGALPFQQRDPLELMHAHVAREPPAPKLLRPDVPEALAQVVLKLLEKDPEARYQSLSSLQLDLELCRDRLAAGETKFSRALDREDRPEGFRISRRLYARESEVQQLTAAFAMACQGRTTWVALEGSAGVGKTSLVRELVNPVAQKRGYYLTSKFELYDTTVPYAAFSQLIDALVRQVLTESTVELASWRERILRGAAGACTILLELCPSLELVVGPQPPLLPLAAAESRTRLREAIFALFSALSSSGRPTCLILDDLHRADADVWFLLEALAGIRNSSLLVVLVFRDGELPLHENVLPPRAAVEKLARAGAEVSWLRVEPLSLPALGLLIEDSVSVQREQLEQVVALVHHRTGGNPFFVRAFLRSLEESPSALDRDGLTLDRVERTPPTDNVIELLVQQVSKLPERTQRILKVAACIGGTFDLQLLAAVSKSAALEDLMPAILDSFVIPVDSAASPTVGDGPSLMRARFAHDRVQQAVLSMLGPAARMQIHGQLGEQLMIADGSSELSDAWFQMIGHLNNALELPELAASRVQLAEWNLKAALAALSRAAAAEALEFARAGVAALGADGWSNAPELMSRLHVVAAEAALVAGEHDTFEDLARTTIDHAVHVLDVVAVRALEGQLHYANFQLNAAAEAYLDALARLGLHITRHPTPAEVEEVRDQTVRALAGRSAATLLELNRCEEPEHVVATDVLGRLIMVAGSTDSDFLSVTTCSLVLRSLELGNTAHSAVGYSFYGRVLAGDDHDVELACSFGRLSLDLADRFGDRGVLAQIHLYANYVLMHWVTPLSELTPSFRAALRHGLEACRPFNTACSAATLCICRFWAADPLNELATDLVECSAVVRRCRQPLVQNWLDVWNQVTLNLRSEQPDFEQLRGPHYDEAQRLPLHLEANDASALYNYYIAKALLCYLARQPHEAVRAIDANESNWAMLGRDLLAIPVTFLSALCDLSACATAEPEQKARLLERARDAERKLDRWCQHNPHTIRVKLAILRAELERVEVGSNLPLARYIEAVELADREGTAFECALAHEVTALAYQARGDSAASDHMRAAHRNYLRWGASAKAVALEREHPGLMYRASGAQPQLHELLQGAGGLDLVDFSSVLNASRAISGEIKLERLLQRLMRLLIESSGAQSGYLILPRDGEWLVECGRTTERGSVTLLESLPLDRAEVSRMGISTSIANFVARSSETVLLDDAARAGPYTTDRYVADNGVRSVLCFALKRRREVLGVVYLENNLVRGAFTPNRRNMLELLSTQAVVALENARLYDSLERKVEERTTELHSKNEQLASVLQRVTDMQQQLLVQEKLAALGSLTASIAHEIKNPLNFVANFAELCVDLARELEDGLSQGQLPVNGSGTQDTRTVLRDLVRSVEKVREHGIRANNIVASMALHARDSRAEPESADLHLLLNQSWSVAREEPSRAEAVVEPKLTTRFAALPSVEVVVEDIGRVFKNLALNARYAMLQKARRAGNGYVPEFVITTHDRGESVEVRLRDNGTGIPSALLDNVFMPFFTTKPAGEGTGLGLSICHDLVARGHAGSLRVESVEGEYTEFILSLPKQFRTAARGRSSARS
jgi:predicted ATPase/signal transduction histidine kinase/tRNA A-37 threonylcarbamoyl transferase component Bud32